ncbi:hypothetical protein BAIN110137_16450 [Bacillus inaquosorum]
MVFIVLLITTPLYLAPQSPESIWISNTKKIPEVVLAFFKLYFSSFNVLVKNVGITSFFNIYFLLLYIR